MTIKFLLVLAAFIVASALGDDYVEDTLYKQEHCIKVTPEKQKILEGLIRTIGDYFTNLTMEHEDIDIRYVRIDIEKHSEDEIEEKEMILKVNINDCKEQEKPTNQVPSIEEEKNKNGLNDGHSGINIEINDESDDQNQNQEKSQQGNVYGNPSVVNTERQNQDQGYINSYKNFDNTESQRQNQIQTQQETSYGHFNPNQGQTGDNNNESDGCDCKKYTAAGLDSLTDDKYDDNVWDLYIKNFDVISALRAQRPTVTIMQLPVPQTVQDLMNCLAIWKNKRIEPVWVYMLEEDNKKEYFVFQ